MGSWVGYAGSVPNVVGLELIAGLVVFVVWASVAAWSRDRAESPARAVGSAASTTLVSRVAAIGSLLVLGVWLVGDVAVLVTAEITWWRYAAPLAAAVMTTACVLVLVERRRSVVEIAVLPTFRRTWRSFASSRQLIAVTVAVAVTVLLTVVAGSASSAGPDGRYDIIDLPGGGSASFYGWLFGLPVLGMSAIILALSFFILLRDSRRPFTRPEIVEEQTELRSATARAVLLPALGASSLCLGGILAFMGMSATGRVGTDIDGVTVMWGTGFSALGSTLSWSGWLLQIGSIALLLATVARGKPQRDPLVTAGSEK